MDSTQFPLLSCVCACVCVNLPAFRMPGMLIEHMLIDSFFVQCRKKSRSLTVYGLYLNVTMFTEFGWYQQVEVFFGRGEFSLFLV